MLSRDSHCHKLEKIAQVHTLMMAVSTINSLNTFQNLREESERLIYSFTIFKYQLGLSGTVLGGRDE